MADSKVPDEAGNAMQRSTDRILTTHTGSLPRPAKVVEQLLAGRRSGPALDAAVDEAVAGVIAKQKAAGIDIINDGEQGRTDYTVHVIDRLTGFEGQTDVPRGHGEPEFPELAELLKQFASPFQHRPACSGPIAWKDWAAAETDIARAKAAMSKAGVAEAFMTSPSPGQIARYLKNAYYKTVEEYLFTLADVMAREYRAIVEAGFILQLDCPDLAMSYALYPGIGMGDYRKIIALNVEALNQSVKDLPADRMRMHVCWGSTLGPHHGDVPLKDIVDIILTAKPAAVSFPGANPRHGHEWKLWQDVKLPAGKAIIPGVIDSTSNFVEHPELVADRIVQYANAVGRENVIAGVDCGFGTFAGRVQVDSKIVWMKLASLADGARLATQRLW
ncbi:MAG: cobalamin-independent methionine synthase II family protein [Hyphomicrobiales bacterium]|nr:cobalamin-independent methionine synthase II family protein [Alphaproteobacteria bacterium]